MAKTAEIKFEGKTYEFPVVTGTENENAIDISRLRGDKMTTDYTSRINTHLLLRTGRNLVPCI